MERDPGASSKATAQGAGMSIPPVGGSPSLEVVQSEALPSNGDFHSNIRFVSPWSSSRSVVETSVRELVGIRARLKYFTGMAY